MIAKILLLVENEADSPSAQLALSLARRLESRVIAVSIVDTSSFGDSPEDDERRSELEEKAWKVLYEVEDDAFEQDVKVSLLLDQGEPLERTLELSTSYEAELIVLEPSVAIDTGELVKRSTIPVLFAHPARRQ